MLVLEEICPLFVNIGIAPATGASPSAEFNPLGVEPWNPPAPSHLSMPLLAPKEPLGGHRPLNCGAMFSPPAHHFPMILIGHHQALGAAAHMEHQTYLVSQALVPSMPLHLSVDGHYIIDTSGWVALSRAYLRGVTAPEIIDTAWT